MNRSVPVVMTVAAAAAVFFAPARLSGGPPVSTALSVSPSVYELRPGQTKDFNASKNPVKWFVNGIAGGNATFGTIDANGLYKTPEIPPANPKIKITATTTATPAQSASADLTILNPQPRVSSVAPNAVNVGAFSIVVKGTGFIRSSKLLLGGAEIATSFVSATELRAQLTDNNARQTDIAVKNPDPGGLKSNGVSFRIMPPVTVTVSPETTTLRIGLTKKFGLSVANALDRTVSWYVNTVKGGNATLGTIDETGTYTPPALLPAGNQVTIKAVSTQDATKSDTAVVNLLNPIPVITSAAPAALTIGSAANVTIVGTGFARGAQVLLGSVPLAVASLTPTQIVARGTAVALPGGMTTIQVINPDPGMDDSNALAIPLTAGSTALTAQQASRFLQRASWGATPESLVKLQQSGIERWLNEQYNAPQSQYPDALMATSSSGPAQKQFYWNAMEGQDQLRQRVAFALSQILVVSGVKTGNSTQLVPYMRLLHQHALGNYFQLLKAVTLNPTMGRFLDMVNNAKANPARGIEPNENYGRELLQLFTLGLDELNMDGSSKRDAFGQTIPAYSEQTVKEFAKALTGWTYAPRPGETPQARNPSNYAEPMVAWEPNHDTSQKALLMGFVQPPGRTAAEDLDAVIQNIANHPNVAPFVSLRLIQRLVMGNPTPGYVARVASVFQSTRGDLRATVRAILTDTEADNPALNQGKLREPVLFILSFLRGLDATVQIDHSLNSYANSLGQNLWFAPSVFNYFSPFFRVNGVVAPEFQINTASVALNRANFIYRAGRNGIGENVRFDIGHFERLASDPPKLADALSNALLNGAMSAEMKAQILAAVNATNDVRVRARNAIFLVGASSQFQVEP